MLVEATAKHGTCGIFDESKSVDSVWGMGSLDRATIITAVGWHTQQRVTPLLERMTASRASAIHGILRGCSCSFASSASSRLQNDRRKRSEACKRQSMDADTRCSHNCNHLRYCVLSGLLRAILLLPHRFQSRNWRLQSERRACHRASRTGCLP